MRPVVSLAQPCQPCYGSYYVASNNKPFVPSKLILPPDPEAILISPFWIKLGRTPTLRIVMTVIVVLSSGENDDDAPTVCDDGESALTSLWALCFGYAIAYLFTWYISVPLAN